MGSRALDRSGFSALNALALVAFGVSVVASAYVLLPKPKLIFAVRGSVLFEREFDEPAGIAETHRKLAYWLESYRDANERTIEQLFVAFRCGVAAVLLAAILWSVDLAGA